MKQFKCLLFLLLNLFFLNASAQRTITGTVFDENGESLIGVTVLEDSTVNGTLTDINGAYELDVTKEGTVLIFSYVGFSPKRVIVGASNIMDVVLTSSATDLDEVVVVGYGTQLRSNITGSVARVKAEDIEGQPVTSLESALQGRVPGVFISKGNGKTGQAFSVKIRGFSSLYASNEPLYVIDGIVVTSEDQSSEEGPTNPIADLNYDDIASVQILKDAAATAIYGSRGSNGVVLITTKEGKAGKPRFSLDISHGFSEPTNTMNWLNREQYLELWNEAFTNVADDDGLYYGSNAEQWLDDYIPTWRDGYDTDWQKEAFNDNAGMSEVQLSVSGGSDRTKYYISGSAFDQAGIYIDDTFQRLSGRLNLTHDASDKIKLGMRMSFSRTVNDRLPIDSDFANPLGLVALTPLEPVYDPDNPDEYFNGTTYFNSLIYREHASFVTTVHRTLGSTYLKWSPIANLTLHTDFGLDFRNQNEDRWWDSKAVQNTGAPNGMAISANTNTISYTTNNFATYDITTGPNNVNVTAGMTFQKFNTNLSSLTGRDFPSDDLHNIASAANITGGTEIETAFAILSYFARANYNYDRKYLLSLSGRIDGDSRFGIGSRYGFFPAVSLGWVVSNEGFLANSDLLSYLKLRASYGQTGNTPTDYFVSRGFYDATRFAGLSGTYQTRVANPDIRWEKTNQVNIGIDAGFWDDRASASVEYYIKNAHDLLLNVNLPRTSGFATSVQNIGEVRNKGFEASVTGHILTGPLRWSMSANMSINRNRALNMRGQVIESGEINRVMEGEPIGVFFAYEYAGVDPDNGDPLFYINKEEGDRSTTNNINEAERVVVGDPNPDMLYGFQHTFRYKGFSLDAFFQGVKGSDAYNGGGYFLNNGFGVWFDNQQTRALDRWQQPGDQTNVPQARFLEGIFEASSYYLQDRSYLRLKNLSFSYQFPKQKLERFGLNQLKLYVSGQNLWTLTNFIGFDPEVNADCGCTDNDNIGFNWELFSGPHAKTVIFGVKVGF